MLRLFRLCRVVAGLCLEIVIALLGQLGSGGRKRKNPAPGAGFKKS
jgi:hypothetical protein